MKAATCIGQLFGFAVAIVFFVMYQHYQMPTLAHVQAVVGVAVLTFFSSFVGGLIFWGISSGARQ